MKSRAEIPLLNKTSYIKMILPDYISGKCWTNSQRRLKWTSEASEPIGEDVFND